MTENVTDLLDKARKLEEQLRAASGECQCANAAFRHDACPRCVAVLQARNALPAIADTLRDLRAEVDRLRNRLDPIALMAQAIRQSADIESISELADRLCAIADEAFGPFPVQSTDDNLTAIERGLFAQRQRVNSLEAACIAARHQLLGTLGCVTHEEHRATMQRAIALCDGALNDGPGPCCEHNCPDMATHFARTGSIP